MSFFIFLSSFHRTKDCAVYFSSLGLLVTFFLYGQITLINFLLFFYQLVIHKSLLIYDSSIYFPLLCGRTSILTFFIFITLTFLPCCFQHSLVRLAVEFGSIVQSQITPYIILHFIQSSCLLCDILVDFSIFLYYKLINLWNGIFCFQVIFLEYY